MLDIYAKAHYSTLYRVLKWQVGRVELPRYMRLEVSTIEVTRSYGGTPFWQVHTCSLLGAGDYEAACRVYSTRVVLSVLNTMLAIVYHTVDTISVHRGIH